MDNFELYEIAATPLPVELLYFEGTPYSLFNNLKWATASEHNADYFDIQTSKDGEIWKSIGIKIASGNSNQLINYSYLHSFESYGINYYKLIQYDFDGKYKEYGPIALDNRRGTKKIAKYINTLGQEVDADTRGIVIIVYEDGSIEKTIR
jgi:hypothetical protein